MNGLFNLIHNGSPIRAVMSATATIDFASIPAAGTQTATVTVNGATANDIVVLGLPATVDAGVIFDARVSAANTVTVRAQNITAGAIDPASASYTLLVFKL